MRGVARLDLGEARGLDDLRSSVELALELELPVEDTAIAMGNLGENVALTEGIARGRDQLEASLEFARPAATSTMSCTCARTSSVPSSTRAAGTISSRKRTS